MTSFLVTDENPDGYKLEDILAVLRKDVILRATRIVDDTRPEARTVLDNNVKILGLLSECISIAEQSSKILEKNFGPHKPGSPRIGVA